MTDQTIYNVAEWLCYNAEAVNQMIKPDVIRWKEAMYNLASTPIFALQYETSIREKLKDKIMYVTSEHHPKLTRENLEEIFQDERVLIIINNYYMKGLL